MAEIGLFPLKLVLLPGEQAPLHIFEPRYKELIEECLEGGAPFGLLLADGSGMREVGTEATVIEVLERFDDGRLNIVVEGGDRFRVVELTHGRSFSTAEVDVLPDESEAASPADVERCLAAYRRVVAAADAELDELDPERESIAYQIAARVDFGVEIKQDLLELRSERDRVRRLAGLLDRAAEAVRRERDIRERASSNGRVDAA